MMKVILEKKSFRSSKSELRMEDSQSYSWYEILRLLIGVEIAGMGRKKPIQSSVMFILIEVLLFSHSTFQKLLTVYHSFFSSMYLTEICNSDFSLKEVKIELLVFTFKFVSQVSFSDTTSTIFPVPNVQTDTLLDFTSIYHYPLPFQVPNLSPQCSVGWLGWTEQGAHGVFCVCGQTAAGTRVSWDLTAPNYPKRFL